MKHRSRDVFYCDVRKDVIKAANPTLNEDVLANLYEFIHDRYEIHKKKDVEKLPAPWTDNPIFLQVKFTNVRREHDRESRNVIDNICKAEASLKDRFFNIILMRFWNKFESYQIATGGKLLKFPLSDEDFEACNKRIADNEAHTWWSGAYYTCPVRSWLERVHFEKKIPTSEINFDQSPIYFAKYALTDELWEKMVAAESPKELFDLLTAIPWMGKFLVYQWFVDFTYCEDYCFSENEYTVSGPGCTKGVDLLFKDRDGMTHEECLFWMRDNQNKMFNKFGYNPTELFSDLEGFDRHINIMSFENLMCELQKFQKCKAAIVAGKKPRGKASYDGLGVKTAKKAKSTAVDKPVNLFEGF
jgi:hypothetical protein